MSKERMKELKTPQLKTILRKVGKTPIDEPEIYNIIKDADAMAFYDVPKFVLDRAKKNIDDYDSQELALFYRLVRDKVIDVKYENDEFKSTPNTKELENISYKDRVSLFALTKKGALLAGDDDEVAKIFEEQRDLVWGIVTLSKNSLTEWEQNLVEAICLAQALDVGATAMDIDLGN